MRLLRPRLDPPLAHPIGSCARNYVGYFDWSVRFQDSFTRNMSYSLPNVMDIFHNHLYHLRGRYPSLKSILAPSFIRRLLLLSHISGMLTESNHYSGPYRTTERNLPQTAIFYRTYDIYPPCNEILLFPGGKLYIIPIFPFRETLEKKTNSVGNTSI